MAPPPPLPLDPAALIDELVEEFLLRLPPEDPAFLVRAALVSRQWYRVVTGPAFRRRFREFHRSTPLLGYIDSFRFVPLSSFRPPHTLRLGVTAVSSSHGHVLLRRSGVEDEYVLLSVWHPITGEQQDLPVVPQRTSPRVGVINWDAAFICAGGDDCDHLHCHFKVGFVGNLEGRHFSCVYSSEADSWSDAVFTSEGSGNGFTTGKCVVIGTDLYITYEDTNEIFKYDLQTHEMHSISMTPGQPDNIGIRCTLIGSEDGRLGLIKASNSTLHLWVRERGRWEESRTIDLQALLPVDAQPEPILPYLQGALQAVLPVNVLPDLLRPYEAMFIAPRVHGFAQTGAGVIFLWTGAGYFTIDLKSGSCKRLGVAGVPFSDFVVPYVNFCTPARGAVSTDDRPGAGVVISRDEAPVAGIAVSTDEGPGAAGMCQVPKKL